MKSLNTTERDSLIRIIESIPQLRTGNGLNSTAGQECLAWQQCLDRLSKDVSSIPSLRQFTRNISRFFTASANLWRFVAGLENTGDAGMANLRIWMEFDDALYAIHAAAQYHLDQIAPPKITARAAAEIIGIDRSTVHKHVKQGRLVLTKLDAERYRDEHARPGKKRGKPTPSQRGRRNNREFFDRVDRLE